MKLRNAIAMLSVIWGLILASSSTAAQDVDFVKDIKPILEKHCLHCHGSENPEAFSMEQDEVFDYIEPGEANSSMLFHVLVTDDEQEFMPPPDFKQPLQKEQIRLVKRWINQGAAWPAGVELRDKSRDEQNASITGFAVMQDDSLQDGHGLKAGVTIFMRVQSARRKIIDIDRKSYEGLAITDSTGRELKIKDRSFWRGIQKSIKLSTGTRDVLLTLHSPVLPDAKSESVRISGVVTTVCYDDTTTEQADLTTAKDKISLDGIDFVIEDVRRKPDVEILTIRSEQSPITALRAVLKDGSKKRLKLLVKGPRYNINGKKSYIQLYQIAGEANEIAKLDVTYCRGVTSNDVPVDFSLRVNSFEDGK